MASYADSPLCRTRSFRPGSGSTSTRERSAAQLDALVDYVIGESDASQDD